MCPFVRTLDLSVAYLIGRYGHVSQDFTHVYCLFVKPKAILTTNVVYSALVLCSAESFLFAKKSACHGTYNRRDFLSFPKMAEVGLDSIRLVSAYVQILCRITLRLVSRSFV